jgi:Flp pilus assembly protein TadG
MQRAVARLVFAEDGSVLVEAAIVMPVFLMLVLGAIDVLYASYQWSAAVKAVQIGLRIAAVSDPVAVGLGASSATAFDPNTPPGSPPPTFVVTCDGAAESCSCEGSCRGVGGYDANAMNTIVYGRNSDACGDSTGVYATGMCDLFGALKPANVMIVYQASGLGYVGRPGSVPVITISLQKVPFQFIFLRAAFGSISIPGLTASTTAEDMSSTAD